MHLRRRRSADIMATRYQDIQVCGGSTSQPLSLAKRLRLVRKHLKGKGRFLDCGCGSGGYVAALIQEGAADAYGVEFSSDNVAAAHQNETLRNRVSQGDIEALNYESNTWDYAMLNEVLEHVPNDRKAVAEAYRILKPGGLLFVFSPNRWFPFESHSVQLKRPRCEVPRWVPFIPYIPVGIGKHLFIYWARNYWQNEMTTMLTGAGFTIVERSFVWQTFENISKRQPWFISKAKPVMRGICNILEKTPFLRRFGLSQVLVCRK